MACSLTGLGPGQTGLIPNAEMGTPSGTDHRKEFAPGTAVKVVVLAIEEGGKRIRLSRAKALVHEEQAETQAYLRSTPQRGSGFGLTLGDVLRKKKNFHIRMRIRSSRDNDGCARLGPPSQIVKIVILAKAKQIVLTLRFGAGKQHQRAGVHALRQRHAALTIIRTFLPLHG